MGEDPFEEFRHGYDKAARFYNLFADDVDIPFYIEFAQMKGSPILELAAGTGRVSISLAREGFKVVALESSKGMLDEFQHQLSKQEPSVIKCIQVQEGDMTEFDLNTQFPLINDGVFIMDLFPGGIQPRNATFSENPVPIGDGKIVTRSGKITTEPIRQLMSLDLTFTIQDEKSGRVLEEITQRSGIALVNNREMELLLRMSNLEIIDEFGDFQKCPYTFESGRRILIIRKKD